jgi:two-component system osmolarity sensor histidine kinase EnvZ
MSTLDTGLTLIKNASQRVSKANGWMGNAFKSWMPTGLYARALLIMIVPMVILQTVVAFVFMERHWSTVTRRLSAAVVSDIAALIDVYKTYPQDKDRAQLRSIAREAATCWSTSSPPATCRRRDRSRSSRCSTRRSRCSSAARSAARSGSTRSASPIWSRSAWQLDDSVMRIFAQRSAAYASNSEIFIFWMLGTSTIC